MVIETVQPAHQQQEDDELLARIRGAERSRGHACRTGPSSEGMPDVDGFRLVRLIAEGGMGRVYEAEQLHPRRRAAVKLLRCDEGAPTHRLRLFQREADALARLRHPDIATVYCAGQTAAGVPFLAMELVEGEPLDVYARRRSLAPNEILRLVARICRAVDHAHDRGVIHRDLKPSNIMVDAHGNPKVLDFGLARVGTVSGGGHPSFTLDGRIAGTLAYMSPEQLAGRPENVDARTDVYALGVILYELLTGVHPLEPGDLGFAEIVDAIRTRVPVSPSRRRHGLDAALDSVVLRALSKDPRSRQPSAGELATDIERHLAGLPPVYPSRHGRGLRFACTAVLLALVGACVPAWQASPLEPPMAALEEADDPLENAAASSGEPAGEHAVHRLAPSVTLVGDLADIEQLLRTRLSVLRADATGKKDVGTLIRLGLVLERQGRYAEAEACFRDCLEGEPLAPYRRTLALTGLGRCVSAQGNHDEAAGIFAECRELTARLGPQRAAMRAGVQIAMARDMAAQGRSAQARELLDRTGELIGRGSRDGEWARGAIASAYADIASDAGTTHGGPTRNVREW